ncbi:MAG: ester cyclase [Proteobacteria bacterium]|nr:ester cyclase [Pseudomonadota bacterium]MBU1740797.1 ester cyclase [Pseudomonadota bacterium]
MSDQTKTVDQFFAAMNRYDVEGMAALLADNVVAWEVAEAEPCRGLHAFKKSYTGLFIGYPDCRCEILEKHDAGQDVIYEVRWTATNTGVFKGVDPTGKPVDLRIAYFFKFDGDKIIRITEYYDLATLLVQQDQLEL